MLVAQWSKISRPITEVQERERYCRSNKTSRDRDCSNWRDTGDPTANKQLSVDRANAIRDQRVQAGVDTSRINTTGYGSEKPLASNDTDEGRAKNRRTELVVVKK